MKKLLAIALGVALLGIVGVQADEKKEGDKKPAMTAEQKKVWKEIVTKYDADKSGRLNKEERAKFTEEDKKKLKDAGIAQREGSKDGEKKEKKEKKQ